MCESPSHLSPCRVCTKLPNSKLRLQNLGSPTNPNPRVPILASDLIGGLLMRKCEPRVQYFDGFLGMSTSQLLPSHDKPPLIVK